MPSRTTRGAIFAALVALLLALLLTSCGVQSVPTISLLPYAAPKGQAWQWTAACPLTPAALSSCGRADPVIGAAQLSGDEWNLGAPASGYLKMSLDPGGVLTIRGNLAAASPCTQSTCITSSANTWVRGYPNVLYGMGECSKKVPSRQSRILRLPLRVRSLPRTLVASATYSADASRVTYDVAYDLWLSASPTRSPCQTTGTVEVMVWTNYDARALLPISMKVATVSIPYSVDGAVHPNSDEWSIYVSNIFAGRRRTAPWGGTVWLVPDSRGVTRGTVAVDLRAVLTRVGELLKDDYGWSNFTGRYWLDSIPFGIEFGPASGSEYSAGPSYFSLQVSKLCLKEGSPVSDGSC